jgi:hypothetical protein
MMMAQLALMLGYPVLLVDFTELAQFLLTSSVPDLEENGSVIGVEGNVGHIDSSGG